MIDLRVPLCFAGLLAGLLGSSPTVRAQEVAKPLTDLHVMTFLTEVQEVFKSQDAEKIATFYELNFLDEAKIELVVKISLPGQGDPVTQSLTLTKQQQIEQLRKASVLFSQAKDRKYSISIRSVTVEPGGARARALYESRESATFDARTVDGTPVPVKSETVSQCTADIVPGAAAPKFAAMTCNASTTATPQS